MAIGDATATATAPHSARRVTRRVESRPSRPNSTTMRAARSLYSRGRPKPRRPSTAASQRATGLSSPRVARAPVSRAERVRAASAKPGAGRVRAASAKPGARGRQHVVRPTTARARTRARARARQGASNVPRPPSRFDAPVAGRPRPVWTSAQTPQAQPIIHNVSGIDRTAADRIEESMGEDARWANLSSEAKVHLVQTGPPPDFRKRRLIFDSMSKIVQRWGSSSCYKPAVTASRGQRKGRMEPSESAEQMLDSRGTYLYTFGAGYHGQLGRRFGHSKKKYCMVPKLVELPEPVRWVACGGLHTAAVSDSGTVYTWGDGRSEQLGHFFEGARKGFSNQQVPRAVTALSHVPVVQVACGQSHSLALSERKTLYSWGLAKSGQLGLGDRLNVKVPTKIDHEKLQSKTPLKFVAISCGDRHSAAISDDGRVYTFGCGEHGQLGHSSEQGDRARTRIRMDGSLDFLRPAMVKALSNQRVVSVSCGAIHTAMLTESGGVYLTGFGEHLFPGHKQNFLHTPKHIPLKSKAQQIACGQGHIMVLTVQQDVLCWGAGGYGQLGHGAVSSISQPRAVLTGKSIAQISAGRYHSCAVTNFGVLYTWGCGENGQLGHGDDENVLVPKIVDHALGTVVGQVSCGEHHTAMITAAPWNKLSPDIREWAHFEEAEYNIKLKLTKNINHTGLTKKLLSRLKTEMIKFQHQYALNKATAEQETEEEKQKDLQSIRRRASITAEVVMAHSPNTGTKAQHQTPMMSSASPAAPEEHSNAVSPPMARQASDPTVPGRVSVPPPMCRQPSDVSTRPPLKRHRSSRKPAGPHAQSPVHQRHHQRHHSAGSSGSSSDGSYRQGRQAQGVVTSWMLTALDHDHGDGVHTVAKSEHHRSPRQTQQETRVIASNLETEDAAKVIQASFLREAGSLLGRLTRVVEQHGHTGTTELLQQLGTSALALRSECDVLSAQRETKAKRLHHLQQLSQLVRPGAQVLKERKRLLERMTELEMRLDTVVIKINETEENKKNYDLTLAHLREEEFDRWVKLETLRAQVAESEALCAKMEREKQHKLQQKDRGEAEMTVLKSEISAYKHFLRKQLNNFKTLISLAKARNYKREQMRKQRYQRALGRIKARTKKLRTQLRQTEKEAKALSEERSTQHDKLTYYERRFQQIASATGLSTPVAIINKFSLKSQLTSQLASEQAEKKATIDHLSQQKAALQDQLARVRADHVEYSWKDVEEAEECLRARTAREEDKKRQSETTIQGLVFMQEGLLALLNSLQRVDGSADGQYEVQRLQSLAEGAAGAHESSEDTRAELMPQLLAAARKRITNLIDRLHQAKQQHLHMRQAVSMEYRPSQSWTRRVGVSPSQTTLCLGSSHSRPTSPMSPIKRTLRGGKPGSQQTQSHSVHMRGHTIATNEKDQHEDTNQLAESHTSDSPVTVAL